MKGRVRIDGCQQGGREREKEGEYKQQPAAYSVEVIAKVPGDVNSREVNWKHHQILSLSLHKNIVSMYFM